MASISLQFFKMQKTYKAGVFSLPQNVFHARKFTFVGRAKVAPHVEAIAGTKGTSKTYSKLYFYKYFSESHTHRIMHSYTEITVILITMRHLTKIYLKNR